jgi:hypothetical protein
MPQRSTTHNFVYTKKDIENLIKADVAKQMKMETIPIVSYSINFNIGTEPYDGPGMPNYSFKNVDVKVETPA